MVNSQVSPATAARQIVRRALKGALATLLADGGWPYASLVTVATAADGSPLMLLSDLAVHTRNLKGDARASLMLDATDATGDPLAGGRVTLVGRVATADRAGEAPRRFLARHPEAAGYAGFADFSFYRLEVETAHYIGGFGRIVDIPGSEVRTSVDGAAPLLAAEAGIVAHMNEDHADAIGLYASRLLGADARPWRMTGIDPGGLDLIAGSEALRLDFDQPVQSPQAARHMLVALAERARSAGP
ncbi:MAG: HugZ family protein [Hyphomicrobiaceae bacterium]